MCWTQKALIVYVVELEKSRMIASSLEERMKKSEQERRELEEARQKAMEAKLEAERAANMEKEERERKVGQSIIFCGNKTFKTSTYSNLVNQVIHSDTPISSLLETSVAYLDSSQDGQDHAIFAFPILGNAVAFSISS